jgi:hypothetical protein
LCTCAIHSFALLAVSSWCCGSHKLNHICMSRLYVLVGFWTEQWLTLVMMPWPSLVHWSIQAFNDPSILCCFWGLWPSIWAFDFMCLNWHSLVLMSSSNILVGIYCTILCNNCYMTMFVVQKSYCLRQFKLVCNTPKLL